MTETSDFSALRDALLARERAPRDAPVRVHNRLMKSVQKQCDVLGETSIGRERLTAAATDDPDLLLRSYGWWRQRPCSAGTRQLLAQLWSTWFCSPAARSCAP